MPDIRRSDTCAQPSSEPWLGVPWNLWGTYFLEERVQSDFLRQLRLGITQLRGEAWSRKRTQLYRLLIYRQTSQEIGSPLNKRIESCLQGGQNIPSPARLVVLKDLQPSSSPSPLSTSKLWRRARNSSGISCTTWLPACMGYATMRSLISTSNYALDICRVIPLTNLPQGLHYTFMVSP